MPHPISKRRFQKHYKLSRREAVIANGLLAKLRDDEPRTDATFAKLAALARQTPTRTSNNASYNRWLRNSRTQAA